MALLAAVSHNQHVHYSVAASCIKS